MSSTTKNDAESPRLLVIDGHSMAFRAFYALPAENFATDTGQHTNAVYGFVSMLIRMIQDQSPTHVGVAFDLDTPTFRSEEYTEYKAGRNKTPEEFYGQIDLIQKVMEAMNIPTLTKDGTRRTTSSPPSPRGRGGRLEVVVVSGDRDAFQLITDKTTVLYPKKGVSDIPPMDGDAVEAKYFVRPERYSDLAALVGETADNLPGVPGVGPKTAAKWINLYGGLEGILENLDSIKGKVGDSLREHVEDVLRNRRLNHLLRDLDLPVTLEALELERPNRDAVEELFDALQFNTLRKRLFDLFGEEEAEAPDTEEVPAHVLLDPAAAVHDWFAANGAAHVRPAPAHGRRSGRERRRRRRLRDRGRRSVRGPGGRRRRHRGRTRAHPRLLRPQEGRPRLQGGLQALLERGIELRGVEDDTMISAYLIQPDRRSHELADIAQDHLRIPLEATAVAAGPARAGPGGEDVASPAVRAAHVVRLLSGHLAGQVLERGSRPAGGHGTAAVRGAGQDGAHRHRRRHGQARRAAGRLHPHHRRRHRRGLRGDRPRGEPRARPSSCRWSSSRSSGCPRPKRSRPATPPTPTPWPTCSPRPSTRSWSTCMTYRDATKLRQTVEGLRKAVADDGRIHTTYAQTVAATGRLSSLNPNLQNIPVRSEEGRRIRAVFIVGEGYETLLTADYSQIEMRIMAHLSGDAA